MHKTLLTVLTFLFTLQVAMAQLTITSTSVSETLDVDVEREMTITLTNTSSSTKTVQWNRTENIPMGWYSYVCDKELCYLPSAGTATFSMTAGEEVAMKLTAYADAAGTGEITLDMFDVDNNADIVSTTFNLNAILTDVEDFDIAVVKIYPNPATDFIKITNADGIETMEIYNLIGKKVGSFNNINTFDTYNVSDLPNGMYLVRLLDEDNEVLGTKRISKR